MSQRSGRKPAQGAEKQVIEIWETKNPDQEVFGSFQSFQLSIIHSQLDLLIQHFWNTEIIGILFRSIFQCLGL